MAFLTGSGASLRIGKEDAFGTAAEASTLVDITAESVSVSVEKGDEGSLLASKTPQTRDLLGVTVDGSFSFILRPEGAALMTHAALGGDEKHTENAGEGTHTHEFNLCGPADNLPSLTLLVDRKASVKKYAGVTVSAFTLECAAGDYVKGSIDLKGVKEEAGERSAGASTFTIPAYRCTSAVFKVGDEVFDISSATFKVDNALEDAPRTYGSGLYAGQPQHAQRSVTISFEIPYSGDVDAFRDRYLVSEENVSVRLLFTSSDREKQKYEIYMPHVSISSVDASVGGTGALTASVEGEALSVGSVEPLTIKITDTSSETV